MNRFLCTILTVLIVLPMQAGPKIRWNAAYQDYIDRYKDLAIEEMLHYGIPASITLAQGLLESGAGRSELSRRGNNHFGIKCHGWTGRTITHDDDANGECFRAYDNVEQSYDDHCRFLRERKRYGSLFLLDRTDYRGWAHGLKAAGYATNPHYAQHLIDIIELYKLNEFDHAVKFDKFMVERIERTSAVPVERDFHPISIYNENYRLKAHAGDTFASIGKEVGLSGRKLARVNERGYHDKLKEGDVVYLKKKQKKALKQFKHHPHTVKSGESLYSIAQTYGIRLKSLVKKNPQLRRSGYRVCEGDKIRIY